MRDVQPLSPTRAVAVAIAATVAGSLPAFITGVTVVQLTRDLAFGAAGLGAAISVYYATGAASAMHLGRLVDRIGAILSLRLATGGAALASLGIATTVQSWGTLVPWLAVAGLAHALGQPAANRLLVGRVRSDRLGVAFGIKQSAPPVASMLAGLSIPAVALTLGWRWAYVLCAGLALIVTAAVGRRPSVRLRGPVGAAKRVRLRNPATIAVLTVAFALAFGANSAMLAFYVDAAVRSGIEQRDAGMVFAAASVAAIATRLVAGVVCDRTAVRPLRLSAALVGSGSVGVWLLALGRPATMLVGIVIALGLTWGFPGVFWLALVRAYPDTPGRITGVLALGGFGAVLSPIAFGAVVEGVGYPTAWAGVAVMALGASGAMLYGAGRLTGPEGSPARVGDSSG